MCGIAGYVHSRKSIDKNQLLQATQILHHRGPEELNIWQSQDAKVGLGHTRLAIIDLVGGHQPLVSHDKTIRAVVNGEFYEYEKIRNSLIAKGYAFRTKSDSEILIALYQEYGTDCLVHLRGEFAFILWDERKNILFAARDRFGIKPLFFTSYENGLYLASEVKALLKFGIPAQWNEEGVLAMIQLVWPEDYTVFKRIYSIKPGHFLLAHGADVKFVKYWDMNFTKAQDLPNKYDEAEYIRIFREKLEDAVRVRLKADVPVVCYLSGGIDSSTILALASKIHNKPVKAFTIIFDDPLFDESKATREMARHVGSELYEVKVTQKDIAENFRNSIWHIEYPLDNTGAIAEYLLSKLVLEHQFKVVLTGDGSDELFAGYQQFREDHINYGHHLYSQEERKRLLEFIKKSPVSAGILSAHKDIEVDQEIEKLLGYIPTQFRTGTLRGNEMSDLYAQDFKRRAKEVDPIKNFIRRLDMSQLIGRDVINTSLYIFNKTFLPGYILNMEGDRAQMAHSIEGRVPYLDHFLAEFAEKLPIGMKIKGIREKYILREAAKDLVTKNIYEGVKHPFLAPPVTDPTDKSMYLLMQEVFHSDILNQMPFFDKEKVLKLLDNLPNMDTREMIAADSLLVTVLSLCYLKERFNII